MEDRRLFFRFLRTYGAAFLAALLLAVLVAAVSWNSIRTSSAEGFTIQIEEGADKFSKSVSSMRTFSRMISGSSSFVTLPYSAGGTPYGSDVSSLMLIHSAMQELGHITDSFDYSFILFRSNDYFISTDEISFDLSEYSKDGMRISLPEGYTDVRQYLFSRQSEGQYVLTLPRIEFIKDGHLIRIDNPLLFLYPEQPSSSLIAFVLSPERAAGILLPSTIREESSFTITDSRGRILTSYGDEGEDDYLIECDIGNTGLYLRAGISDDMIWAQMRPVVSLIVIFLLIGIIAAVILTVIFSLRRMNIFSSLFSSLPPQEGKQEGDEFKRLKQGIDGLVESRDGYMERNAVLSRENREIRLSRLVLYGVRNEDDTAAFMHAFGCIPSSYVVVVTEEREAGSCALRLEEAGFRTGAGITPSGASLFVVECSEDRLSQLATLLAEAEQEKAVGISAVHTNLFELSAAYIEAQELERAIASSDGVKVAVHGAIPSFCSNPVSEDVLSRLRMLIVSLNKEEAEALIRGIFSELSSDPHGFEVRKREVFYSLSNLFFSVYLMVSEDYIRPEYSDSFSASELCEIFCSMTEKAVTALDKERRSHNNDLKNRIIEYIDTHYSDVSLSAHSVVTELGISEKYLSVFLKEQTGRTFPDYLLSLRLEKARILLDEGVLSNEKIAAEVGFGGLNTFYRNFQKKYGVTPGVYRDNHLLHKE